MGVHGLWHLLQSTGRPVTLESLEGKVLAVDVSMWMHQLMKGMRDSHGNPVPNAHLIGLYHRICKLLYYRIKPVFVFDGGVPALKKQTTNLRRQKREEADEGSSKATKKLLSNLLKQHAVGAVLGTAAPSSSQIHVTPTKSKQPDIFDLKPLPMSDRPFDQKEEDNSHADRMREISACDVDIESEEFKALPAEMRHEILTDVKEQQKFSVRTSYDTLPRSSQGFSDYQVQKFLKQTQLSQRIADVRRELKAETVGQLADVSDEHQVESSRVASEDASHYILIKGLSKSRQCEMAATLAEQDVNTFVKKEKIDKEDYWVEKRRQEAQMPRPEDCLPKERRPLIKSETVVLSEESEESETEDLWPKEEISDFSQEGGFFREEEDESKNETKAQSKAETRIETRIEKLDSREEIGDEELADLEIVEQSSDLSADASKDNKYRDLDETVDRAQPVIPLSPPSEPVMLMSDSDSESDSDFIEVKGDPEQHEDDLFPVSIFSTDNKEREQEIREEKKGKGEEEEGEEMESEEEEETREEVPSDNEFEGMSKDELIDLQKVLEVENTELHNTRNQQDRMATSLTEQMNIEAQELVRLFGLPYVVSPMEAEAQCAFLDLTSQTNGTVTDDSDIWLFGGRNVYKNLFNSKRHVEWFRFEDFEKQLFLTREKLVNMALVCGSDYTPGIHNAGPVAAMEIMGEFPAPGLRSLQLFKQWWDEAQTKVKVQETKVKIKLRKLVINEGFPSEAVVDAYMNPTVDESREDFSWGRPDLDLLRQYAKNRFGWNKEKIDESLLPVMKQINAKQDSQLRMTQFFPSEMTESRKLKSQRVRRVINVIRSSPNKKMRVAPPAGKSKTQKSKGLGGFVLKTSSAVEEPRVDLSESSEDGFSDSIVDDEILANIDLSSLQQKDIKSRNKSTKSQPKKRRNVKS